MAARAESLKRCIPRSGTPSLVAIGSSTMASVLGPQLERHYKGAPLRFALWGKASTSLVRPDFFDWPSKIPGILKRHKPEVWVVSLGTNDNQPVKLRRGGWIRTDDPRWDQVFGERVDELLELAVGPERSRAVVWVGPYAFPGEGSRVLGRRINDVLKARLEAFPGPVFYVDAYQATLDARGVPIVEFVHPGTGKRLPARGNDGIHLKAAVVKALLTDPAAALVAECLGR